MVWSTKQHQQLLALCERLGVAKLWLFGSAATGRFDPARSDLDFLVETVPTDDPLVLGENLLGLWDGLEALFGRRVDLVSPDSVTNPYLWASIERSRQLLYDRTGQQVPA